MKKMSEKALLFFAKKFASNNKDVKELEKHYQGF